MSRVIPDWYPLRLTAPARPLVTGGRAIAQRLGRGGLRDWPIAETWEVSDVDGYQAEVTNGPLAGCRLRELVLRYPQELMGRGWKGTCFPVLAKFIDASGALPVHLHADDATARRLEAQPNGKTEAWHILDAAPGATALCGLKDGVSRDRLHEALLAQDFDAVMRRLPVRAGDTIYVPAGTLHSFGPNTLVYEIEQTSNIQQHAMRWQMEDGSTLSDGQWHENLDLLLQEVKLAPQPDLSPGLKVPVDDAVDRTFLCAGPYFALERWRAGNAAPIHRAFHTAQILSNVGAPVRVHAGGWNEILQRAATLLLPAKVGSVQIDGPADVLFGYLPDLDEDVFQPLLQAGYRPEVITSLGEGFDELDASTTAPSCAPRS